MTTETTLFIETSDLMVDRAEEKFSATDANDNNRTFSYFKLHQMAKAKEAALLVLRLYDDVKIDADVDCDLMVKIAGYYLDPRH